MQAQGADEVENGVNTFCTYTNYINCTLFQGTKRFLLLVQMHCISITFSGFMEFEGCSGRDLIWKMDVEARDLFRKGGRKAEAGSGQRRRWQKSP